MTLDPYNRENCTGIPAMLVTFYGSVELKITCIAMQTKDSTWLTAYYLHGIIIPTSMRISMELKEISLS
jgi:hypothetical protein